MWKMFCWGLLVGWLVQWILDWLFWRKNNTLQTSYNAGTGMTGAGLATGLASNPVGAKATTTAAGVGATIAAAAAVPGVMSYRDDDIEAIEGIGPKIAELLRNNGITTFAQLADAPLDHISKILDAGGSRFKLANPGTWAEQAKLAAKGDWAGFKKLQDELTAGVRLAKDDQ
jgi:predicted flap endonuclease-1-like 5' DNA nuclease